MLNQHTKMLLEPSESLVVTFEAVNEAEKECFLHRIGAKACIVADH